MKDINLNEIQLKLYDLLKDSKWNEPLKLFILSDDFLNILNYLWEESYNGRKFTPIIKQLFRAFNECPYDQLRVVVVGQDPYPKIHAADGIAFSCSNKNVTEASLRFIFKEIERTIYPENEYIRNNDLKRWSNQGILLLNTALTTEVGKIGKHYEIWKPFITFLFDSLKSKNKNLIYVFMGKKSQELRDHVDINNNHIINVSHPASGVYNKQGWNCNDMFNEINSLLKINRIEW